MGRLRTLFGSVSPAVRVLDLDGLAFTLTRRPVRGLRLSLGPDGSPRVSAPRWLPEAAILAFVRSKLAWIRRHQGRLADAAARDAAERAALQALPPAQRRARDRAARRDLLAAAEALRPRWEAALGVQASGLGVRAMRSRWGTCNLRSRRITLALGLLKHPPECLELILVHELAHLQARRHDRRFKSLLDRHLPDWRQREKILKEKPVSGGMPPFGTEKV